MQVIVSGRNTHVSSHMKKVATEKLERVERFFDRIQTMQVEFSEEHNPRLNDRKHTVEVTVTTKQHTLRAHASGPDPSTAVDSVLGKIESQIKKLKGKFVKRGSRIAGAKRANARAAAAASAPPVSGNGSELAVESDATDGMDDEDVESRISRVKRFAVKPMTPDEAVLQMVTLGHDFFLFMHSESEQAGVVYRRSDGSFGLIEQS